MGKVLKRVRNIICSGFMCAVILCTNVGTSYVSAATVALPTTYALWEMLFLSLGITVQISDSSLIEDVCNDFFDTYKLWWESNFGEEAMADNKEFLSNIWDYFKDGCLTLPQTVWNGLKAFMAEDVVAEIAKAPSGTVPYGDNCTYAQFVDCMFNIYDIDEKAFNVIESKNFFGYIFDCFDGNGIFFREFTDDSVYLYFVTLLPSVSYGIYEINADGSALSGGGAITRFESRSSGYYRYYNYSTFTTGGSGSSVKYTQDIFNYSDICALVINGCIYDFDSIFTPPINNDNRSREHGSLVKISDFAYAPPLSENISSSVNSAIGGSVSDIYANSAYDVLTPGRTWDEENKVVQGEVSIPVPSADVLADYHAGLITWQQLLNAVGVRPIDTASQIDLMTAESISSVIEGVGDEVVTEISTTNILLRSMSDTLTAGFASVTDAVADIFVIDTAAISTALAGFEAVWEEKLPFASNLMGMFEDIAFAETYDYPVIKMRTPDILNTYYTDEYIILCDFANYAAYCLWARGLIKALLWFSFGISLFNHIRTDFHVG